MTRRMSCEHFEHEKSVMQWSPCHSAQPVSSSSAAVCTVTDHDMMEKPLKLDIPVCLVINDHHEHSVTTSPSHQTSSVT